MVPVYGLEAMVCAVDVDNESLLDIVLSLQGFTYSE